MNNLKTGIVAVLLTFLIYFNATAQDNLFRSFDNKENLASYANQVWADFNNAIKNSGGKISDSIIIGVRTTPLLVYFHQADSIFVPFYSEMPDQFKQLFNYWGGNSEVGGRQLFNAAFNWFYIPHEMAHYQQFYIGKLLGDKYANEYIANQVAVAFWVQQGQEEKLLALQKLFKSTFTLLPNPVPPGQDARKYFTDNYQQIGQNPQAYGYFQLKMVIEIIDNRKALDLAQLVK